MTFPRIEDCKRANGALQDILADFDERLRAELVAVAGSATARGLDSSEALRFATSLLMNLTVTCAAQCDEETAAGEAAPILDLAQDMIAARRGKSRATVIR